MGKTLAEIGNEISEFITTNCEKLIQNIEESEDVTKFTDPVDKALTSLGFKTENMGKTALLGILIATALTALVLLANVIGIFGILASHCIPFYSTL